MNKTTLMFLAFGAFFLVGCTATIQSASEAGDPVKGEIKTLADGTKYLVHPSEILSGGPPKDGIPSLDNPRFTQIENADVWLNDDDLVLGLDYKGSARAYPHRILNWHEIVNDKVDGERILITYCPLCRTGIAFKPIVDGQEVEFGTSGKLYNSELVMYDRKTDSYWAQSLGKAIIGPSTGQVLEKVPLDTVRWKDWKKAFPKTLVLSKSTGFFRDYDRNPYSGYETSDRLLFPIKNTDNRLKPKIIVYGVEFDDNTKAYAENDVEKEKLINDVVGNVPIVVVWDPQLNTVKIFERTLNEEVLEFTLDGNEFKDNNGNTWTVSDMKEKLKIVDTFGHFWFAWAAFFPDTKLYVP